jgi:Sulfotransferase domain
MATGRAGLDFICIGGQKCASTFVHRAIAQHPGCWMPRPEIHWFEDPDYASYTPARLEALVASCDRPSALRGVKRPALLGREECAPRLAKHFPEAKLIAVLRNPVDRAISAYYHFIKNGIHPPQPLRKGLGAILDGRARWPGHARILTFGEYHRHLTRFLEHFRRDQLLVLLYDDVKTDPGRVVGECYRFLGVDAAFRPPAEIGRPQHGLYSLPRLRWRALRAPFVYELDVEHSRSYAKRPNSMAGALVSRAVASVDMHVLARVFGEPPPDKDPEITARLREYYADDVARLAELLGRDLSHWITPAPHVRREVQ